SPTSTPFPYTTLFRSPTFPLPAPRRASGPARRLVLRRRRCLLSRPRGPRALPRLGHGTLRGGWSDRPPATSGGLQATARPGRCRSEEHTSELQSRENL